MDRQAVHEDQHCNCEHTVGHSGIPRLYTPQRLTQAVHCGTGVEAES